MGIMVKEEPNRIEPEINQGMNYKILIQVGAGILMVYFILFAFNTLSSQFNYELFYLFHGEYNDKFVVLKEIILSTISFVLMIPGLYFFIKGLRKMKKTGGKTQERGLQIFNIFFVVFMVTTLLTTILEAASLYYEVYLGDIPTNTFVSLFFTIYIASFVLFGFVIILIGIQTNLLRRKELIDTAVVKRPVVHFFMLSALIIWLFFVININTQIINVAPQVSLIGYVCSQIITSFLAAGVYLELVIKVERSCQAIKKKLTPKAKRKN